jgi:hypothetical protein
MAQLNSNYYMSQSEYDSDRMRFREVYKDYSSMRLIGHSIDGKTYYCDRNDLVIGKPDWKLLETRCASCGTDHGVSSFDEKERCEVTIRRKNKILHNLFFERNNYEHSRL